jgi:hypothetical protein
MIIMGKAKKTHVETSQRGKLSGLSSIAQNAESGISCEAVFEGKEFFKIIFHYFHKKALFMCL